jgi:hypothetical protein
MDLIRHGTWIKKASLCLKFQSKTARPVEKKSIFKQLEKVSPLKQTQNATISKHSKKTGFSKLRLEWTKTEL